MVLFDKTVGKSLWVTIGGKLEFSIKVVVLVWGLYTLLHPLLKLLVLSVVYK